MVYRTHPLAGCLAGRVPLSFETTKILLSERKKMGEEGGGEETSSCPFSALLLKGPVQSPLKSAGVFPLIACVLARPGWALPREAFQAACIRGGAWQAGCTPTDQWQHRLLSLLRGQEKLINRPRNKATQLCPEARDKLLARDSLFLAPATGILFALLCPFAPPLSSGPWKTNAFLECLYL